MINEILEKYNNKGEFSFRKDDDLKNKCNAPTSYSGIYLIYYKDKLIYIGSSGQLKDGQLKTRVSGLGGIKDRIVNGYHPKFGKVKRRKIFPIIMENSNMNEILIKWYVTCDNIINFDLPNEIEKRILNLYLFENENRKPIWHK